MALFQHLDLLVVLLPLPQQKMKLLLPTEYHSHGQYARSDAKKWRTQQTISVNDVHHRHRMYRENGGDDGSETIPRSGSAFLSLSKRRAKALSAVLRI